MMENTKNLTTILEILDYYWGKIESDLSNEELLGLKRALSNLDMKLKSNPDNNEVNKISEEFLGLLEKIEPLEFLATLDRDPKRSGDLPNSDKEIRIKILNVTLRLLKKMKAESEETKN